jgi:hypothetical protein
MLAPEINSIYEQSRTLLPQLDQMSKLINQIDNQKLKSVLREINNTVQEDFLVFSDIVVEAMSCETPEQLNELINLFEDSSEG